MPVTLLIWRNPKPVEKRIQPRRLSIHIEQGKKMPLLESDFDPWQDSQPGPFDCFPEFDRPSNRVVVGNRESVQTGFDCRANKLFSFSRLVCIASRYRSVDVQINLEQQNAPKNSWNAIYAAAVLTSAVGSEPFGGKMIGRVLGKCQEWRPEATPQYALALFSTIPQSAKLSI